MRLTETFLALTVMGAEWVLWLLVGLSVISVGIMLERAWFFARHTSDVTALAAELKTLLRSGKLGEARGLLKGHRGVEARVIYEGLGEIERGPDAVSEAMLSARARERLGLEANLAVLGTLGNNVPFVGLFGTVLGIIKASREFAVQQQGTAGATAVMSGVFEALVATAVGLLVAIPAVMAFNFFQRRVRAVIGRIDTLAHLVLSEIKGRPPGEGA